MVPLDTMDRSWFDHPKLSVPVMHILYEKNSFVSKFLIFLYQVYFYEEFLCNAAVKDVLLKVRFVYLSVCVRI
jgi:hypothetical protein